MASSIEIIHAQKRGRRIFNPLVKEGANVNAFRNGRRIKEHFSPTEPLILGNLNIGDRVQRDDDPSHQAKVTNKTAQRFAIDDGNSNQRPDKWSIVDQGESKVNEEDKRTTTHGARRRAGGEMKEAPPKIIPRLLRSTTEGLDESCSRFFGGTLPNFKVTDSDKFEIEGQQYKVLGTLGEGTYGLVINAQNTTTHEEVAVKFMFGDTKGQQRTELAMQYYLGCMLETKRAPPGSALVPRIYTIADLKSSKKKRTQLEMLKNRGIERSLVGVMEKLDGDLENLFIGMTDDDKIPIVKQVLKEVAQTLKHVNEFSTEPVFVHGDLHTGNVMYNEKNGEYQFYIMDLGMSEIVHHGGRTTSPNRGAYTERTPERWRHKGSEGNDLCMLCLSIVQMFEKARLADLPELFRPILDYFETIPPGDFEHYVKLANENKQELPLENALEIFSDASSPFYLGCDPGEGRWPLGKDEDGEHLPLFHYFGYDKVDENENVTKIFAPGNFLRKYI